MVEVGIQEQDGGRLWVVGQVTEFDPGSDAREGGIPAFAAGDFRGFAEPEVAGVEFFEAVSAVEEGGHLAGFAAIVAAGGVGFEVG